MSLDVYLTMPGPASSIAEGPRIFVREEGQIVEISRAEWDRRNPGVEPCTIMLSSPADVFEANITHNLHVMAAAAVLYYPCWRPEEIGATKAKDIAPLLREGLARLKAEPEKYRKLDASNGWGTYDQFVPWVERYLAACEEYPEAEIRVSR